MNYMCCKCKVVFSANSDDGVAWSYSMPVCNSCKSSIERGERSKREEALKRK